MTNRAKHIRSSRYVQVAIAHDSLPPVAERVKGMLWWGRRMSVARRYVDGGPMTILTGQTLMKSARRVTEHYSTRRVHLGVSFEQFAQGFSISWTAGHGDGTEEGEWKRWHAGDQESIEIVELLGSGPKDGGPQGDEYLRITRYNQHKYGEEILVGFDTDAYWVVARARDEAGYALADPVGLKQCQEFAQDGPYRVPCAYPVVDGECTKVAQHVDRGAAV